MFTLNYRHGDTSPLPFDWLVRTASKITRLWSQRRRVSYIFRPERTTTANSFDRCRRDASIAEGHFETADHLQQGIAPLPVGCPIARSSLVRRLVLAKDDAAKQRIRAWLSDIDDERLSYLGLTSEDIAALRGTASPPVEATIAHGLNTPPEDSSAPWTQGND